MIKTTDMFNLTIKPNKYDLILSVSTINHGYKKDISRLINKIYKALLLGGKAFITIPDKKSLKTWGTFKKYKRLDKNTVLPLIGPEKEVLHSFYTKQEIKEMFNKFTTLEMEKDIIGQWIVIASK
ncbi:hypothetical protein K8R42_03480 [bacterium]|nr:hypothetical protein [bacterium]